MRNLLRKIRKPSEKLYASTVAPWKQSHARESLEGEPHGDVDKELLHFAKYFLIHISNLMGFWGFGVLGFYGFCEFDGF